MELLYVPQLCLIVAQCLHRVQHFHTNFLPNIHVVATIFWTQEEQVNKQGIYWRLATVQGITVHLCNIYYLLLYSTSGEGL